MITAALLFAVTALVAQEADHGLDVRMMIGSTAFASPELTDIPRSGAPVAAGFRSLLYSTWKINRHWTVTGVVQARSRPYFSEDFTSQGYGVKVDVLQASLGYSQFWAHGSLVARVGLLPSAFGSFLLRYSDMDNPLIDVPLAYGYYYRPVTNLALTGAQLDATWGSLDFRAQLANSSPGNRRNPWARDQYANWTAGAGYTIMQGFRVGVSAYRGPYLDRANPFFRPNEWRPVALPATAYGMDVSWARGHTSVNAEWQRFIFTYHVIPTFYEQTSYGEIKQVIHPRWYIAGRAGYMRTNYTQTEAYEAAVGFRPSANQLLKAGYQLQRNGVTGHLDHIVALQYVAVVNPLVLSGH